MNSKKRTTFLAENSALLRILKFLEISMPMVLTMGQNQKVHLDDPREIQVSVFESCLFVI